MLAQGLAFGGQGIGHIAQLGLQHLGPFAVGLQHPPLGRRSQQLPFELRNLAQLLGIDQGSDRRPHLLVGQPGNRYQKGQQNHDVLGHLGPGDGPHAAKERAQQHAAQPQHDADLELHAGQARSDQAHAVDLCHHIGERAGHGRQGGDDARPAPAKAGLEEIGNRVQPHGPQMRCDQHGDEAEAASPAHDIRQPPRVARGAAEALQVKRTREADERSGAHPVRRCGHAVVERRDTPPGHVIFLGVAGAQVHADGRIDHDGEKQEDRPNPVPRQPLGLGPEHEREKAQHARDIQHDDLVQPPAGNPCLSHGEC